MHRLTDEEVFSSDYEYVLRSCPLFSGVDVQEIPAMLTCLKGEFRRYGKKEFIFLEGDAVEAFGVVLSGCVQILQEDYYGSRCIVSSLGTGAAFGEAFVCSKTPRYPVSVLATEETVVLLVHSGAIFERQNPCRFHHLLMENLLHLMAGKNVFMNERLRSIIHKTTREKLLAYLTAEKRRQGSSHFTIAFDRQELADYLGVERSAMSAELSKMQREGLLITRRNEFTLLGKENL